MREQIGHRDGAGVREGSLPSPKPLGPGETFAASTRVLAAARGAARLSTPAIGFAGQSPLTVGDLHHRLGNQRVQRLIEARPPANGPIRSVPQVRDLPSMRLGGDLAGRILAARAAGQPLDPTHRVDLEGRLGQPLPGIRVHVGSAADELTREVDAEAFTVGADIFFARASYAPETRAGKHLLLHEVVHTFQQRGASTSGALWLAAEESAAEREATSTADAAMRRDNGGFRRGVVGAFRSGPPVHRYLQVQRQPRTRRKGRTEEPPAPVPGEAEFRAVLDPLQNDFNFEMNSLQNNLTIVGNVLDLKEVPKVSFAAILVQRLVSEAFEAIPMTLLAEGLKVLFDAGTKYGEAKAAAQAATHHNQIRQHIATSAQALQNQAEIFAWFYDTSLRLGTAGNEALRTALWQSLKQIPRRPRTEYIRKGEIYRQSLHQAFIVQKGFMKEAHIEEHISAALYKQAAAQGRDDWLPWIMQRGEPFLHAFTAATWRGGRDVTLVRFCGLSKPHLENLFSPLRGTGAGFTPGSLYLWWRTSDQKPKREFRPPPEREIVDWVLACR
jgi:hypothetical protein